MSKEKILVAEDEEHMLKVVLAYLKKENYLTKGVNDGNSALKEIDHFEPDLLILDLMLPGLSGEKVCQRIRQHSKLPILMLTAKSRPDDKINGFKLGADDYLVKPFNPKELIARIKAILRRSDHNSNQCDIIVLGNEKIKINFDNMKVTLNNKDVELTSTEFKVLKVLIENSGQVLSREQLIDHAFGFKFNGFDRTIDTHIKNIRRKLSLKKDEYIKTVYGAGYKFVGDNYE